MRSLFVPPEQLAPPDEPGITQPSSTDAPPRGAVDRRPVEAGGRRESGLSLSTVLGLLLDLWGLMIGLATLGDNSFLTHLATGRLILENGRVPTADPYSFTAHGEPWVVQSWLASVAYAAAEATGGLAAVRLLLGVTAAALALLVWRLCRPATSLVGQLSVAALAIGVGSGEWVERPLIFGLLFLAIVLVSADGGLDPRFLVPVMWLWVNMHGSFPLAVIVRVLLAAGRRLDGQRPTTELRALRWVVVGIVAGGINPIGPRLLVFPLELLRKSSAFQSVVEWQPPDFGTSGQKLFLVQLLVAVVLLVRRPTYRVALPLAGFALMALLAARNVAPASLILVPGMAAAVGASGDISGAGRSRLMTVAGASVGALAILVTVVSMSGPTTSLALYPADAVTWLDDRGQIDPDSRIVSRDYVGNYLEARYGPDRVRVFTDDRVDMYPQQVAEDETALLRGDRGWNEVLVRNEADVVLWDRDEVLAQLLETSPEWRVVYEDEDWLIAVPAQSSLGERD